MDFKKILDIAKKLEVQFKTFDEAIKENKTSIVLKNSFPRGIYIPLSDLPRLVKMAKELWVEIKGDKEDNK